MCSEIKNGLFPLNYIILFLFIFYFLPLQAAEDEPVKPRGELFRFLEKPHSVLSGGVEALSKRIDTFFSGERAYEEATGSHARLIGQSVFEEGGDANYRIDVRGKVVLPSTQKKLRLLIETDTEDSLQQRKNPTNTQETPKEAIKESDYYAAIEGQVRESKKWNIDTDLGIRLRTPPDPFTRLKLRRTYYFTYWEMKFFETFFWFDSKGWGSSSTLDFDRQLREDYLFRSSTNAYWTDKLDHFELGQEFFLFHEIDDRRAVVWEAGVFGLSQPVIHATTYRIGVKYRHRIHKDWLFFEIKPEVFYRKEDNFESTSFLTFSLEMIMGDKFL